LISEMLELSIGYDWQKRCYDYYSNGVSDQILKNSSLAYQ